MKRKINPGRHQIEALPIPLNFESEPKPSLTELAGTHKLRWLLAHADDGVIWGELREDELHLTSDAFHDFSPPLRSGTLQQARLFGPTAELLVWKDGGGWRTRLIRDDAGESAEYYDETHLLWGDREESRKDGFVLVCQGKEGLRHAPPLPAGSLELPVRLQVRHYLAYDPDGQAYIAYSRLVALVHQGGAE